MRTDKLFTSNQVSNKSFFLILIFIILLAFLFSFLIPVEPVSGQTFDQKFSVEWVYDGSNSDVLFLLYYSPSGPDSTFFINRKPFFKAQSILESGYFTLNLNIYLPCYMAARNCIIFGQDTVFSRWAYATIQHRPSKPRDLKFYLR